MESHSAHPFGLAAFTSGAGLHSESEMLLLGGHKPLGGLWPLGEDTLQEPEASEGHEEAVHGLVSI